MLVRTFVYNYAEKLYHDILHLIVIVLNSVIFLSAHGSRAFKNSSMTKYPSVVCEHLEFQVRRS